MCCMVISYCPVLAKRQPAEGVGRSRENMVGVNMALAQHPQNMFEFSELC